MPLCQNLSALGNYVIVANVGALPSGAARYTGMAAFQTDTQQLKVWDGTGWVVMSEPAQTWAPTWHAGMTAGNGTWTNPFYHRSDGYCDFQGHWTLGSTSAVTGQPSINLPIAAFSTMANQLGAELHIASGGGLFYQGYFGLGSTSFANLYTLTLAGANIVVTVTSASVPSIWAPGDEIKIAGRYRMTTRYS